MFLSALENDGLRLSGGIGACGGRRQTSVVKMKASTTFVKATFVNNSLRSVNNTVNRFLGLVVLPVLDVILEKKATRSKTVRGGWLACLRVDPAPAVMYMYP